MPKQENISPPLFTLSIEEFMALHKELINQEFAKLTDSKVNKKSYFNFEVNAAFLRVSKPTFSKLRKEDIIHVYESFGKQNSVFRNRFDLTFIRQESALICFYPNEYTFK